MFPKVALALLFLTLISATTAPVANGNVLQCRQYIVHHGGDEYWIDVTFRQEDFAERMKQIQPVLDSFRWNKKGSSK